MVSLSFVLEFSSKLIGSQPQSSIFSVETIRIESNTENEIYLEISTEALGTALRSAKVRLASRSLMSTLTRYDLGMSDVHAQAVEEGRRLDDGKRWSPVFDDDDQERRQYSHRSVQTPI